MQELMNRFSLDAVKFNGQMLGCLIFVWLVVVATALSSLASQPFTRKQRLFWGFLVVCVPVFGLLAYLPFSMVEGRHSGLFGSGAKNN
jgi:hypothetical protein